jgi:uncharacterized protein (TIGR02594 family)
MTSIVASVGRLGRNRRADVQTIQNLLNANVMSLAPLRPVSTDGRMDDATLEAIELFQTRVERAAKPNGLVTPHGATFVLLKNILGLTPAGAFDSPAWLKVAADEEGTRESAGLTRNNPRILEYLASVAALAGIKYQQHGTATRYMMSDVDETAWCACFVNWCLKQAGKPAHGSASARAWLRYGHTTGPKTGAICIIYRKPFSDSASGWHVGFWIGGPPQAPILLGGNQNNKVCRKQFVGIEQVYFRWPY